MYGVHNDDGAGMDAMHIDPFDGGMVKNALPKNTHSTKDSGHAKVKQSDLDISDKQYSTTIVLRIYLVPHRGTLVLRLRLRIYNVI